MSKWINFCTAALLVAFVPFGAVAQTVPTPFAQYVDLTFAGKYRAGPKTSYAKDQSGNLLPVKQFDSVAALKKSLLNDVLVRSKYAGFQKVSTAPKTRFAEERFNVTVPGYIHAVKAEVGPKGDHDFHVMIGDAQTIGQGTFLTVEVAGLPADGIDRDKFVQARQQLLSLLPVSAEFKDHFARIDPPIAVNVTGSLFFDGDHSIGDVGPDYAKPSTVWEIHPVYEIVKRQ